MKNKDELVKQKTNLLGDIEKEKETLQDIINRYNELTEQINILEKDLEKYQYELVLGLAHTPKNVEDALILYSKESTLYYEHKLSDGYIEFDFIHQHNLYEAINYLIASHKEKDFEKHGINLYDLKNELISTCKDLTNFITLNEIIESLEEQRTILINRIKLDNKCENESNAHPLNGHCLIDLGDELKCVYCDFTTKNYDLTKEEFEFIKLCAEKRNLVLENVTLDDLPLIQNIVKDQEKEINYLEKRIEESDESLMDRDFNFDLFDTLESTGINLQHKINMAHRIDNKIYTNSYGDKVYNTKYLEEEKSKGLINVINSEINNALNSSDSIDAKSKEDLIKRLKVNKFEILILSGNSIPETYDKLDNEEDKECFIIAYSHLNDCDYRVNSGHFKNEKEAVCYDCITANPEINKRLLKIKSQEN